MQRPRFPPTPCSITNPEPAAPAASHKPKDSHKPPIAHQPHPSQRGKARGAPYPCCSPHPSWHAESPALGQTSASRMHRAFRIRYSRSMPPPCLRSPWLVGLSRLPFGPPPSPSPSLRHRASHCIPADGRCWDVGRGLLAREGCFSPAWVLSPGSRVHARGQNDTYPARGAS